MSGPDLLAPWVDAVGPGPAQVRLGREVLARYGEPHRRYHDLRHLSELLHALHELTSTPPRTVVLAAYWHDAVYDLRPGDDERRSADLARAGLRGLGRSEAECDEVARLVLLTARHDPRPDDVDGALLCDADLAVLAADEARYRTYASDVRSEYAHVDDDTFRAGRTAVLRALLDRPCLYTGRRAGEQWEAAARRNVRAELSRLADGSSGGADQRP